MALKTDPDILSLAELGSLMTALGNYGLESERCANAGPWDSKMQSRETIC